MGAVAYLVFCIVRPLAGFDTETATSRWSAASSAALAITFFVSVEYHILSPTPLAYIARVFDHGAIDIAIAIAAVADISLVTQNFKDTPAQAYLDPLFIAAATTAFFIYRRWLLPPEDTIVSLGSCRLGLFRIQHQDGAHAPFRSSAYFVLAFLFSSYLPCAFENLSPSAAMVVLGCNGASLALLIVGLVIDDVLQEPDLSMQKHPPPAWTQLCYSKTCGCIASSHAWWHFLSLVSVAVLTCGREIALADAVGGGWGGGDQVQSLD